MADHRGAALRAKKQPGVPVLLSVWSSRAGAVTTLSSVIRNASNPAYLPAGSFDGEVRMTIEGPEIWITYTG